MLCWLGSAAQAAAPALYNNTQQMMAEGEGILMRWIRMVLETSLPKDGAWFQTGSCYRWGQMRLEITARSLPKRSKERFKVLKHVADGAADATIFVLSVAISNHKTSALQNCMHSASAWWHEHEQLRFSNVHTLK